MASPRKPLLGAREAAALLGIKLETLYAYASRGLVRRVPGPDGRRHQYLRTDLERLRARREARSGHGPVAAGALRFGAPVLDSMITRITEAGPVYRERPALELAAHGVPFTAVAELLWTGELPAAPPRWSAKEFPIPVPRLRALLPERCPPLAALAIAVPALAARDPNRFEYERAALLPRARELIVRMAAALALPGSTARVERALAIAGIERAVALALGARGGPAALRAIRRALVLCADHELNASAFAARVAASAGADLYGCVSAGLAALSGPRHGGTCDRVEALVRQVGAPSRARHVVVERANGGREIPGFGHPLYPEGDPRMAPLLADALALAPRAQGVRACEALVEAMRAAGRSAATIDVGLVALAHALGLKPGGAVGLFAVGRAAGWIAHALEQYDAGYLMRPRARYPETT
jgi:citrate synthase